MTLQLERLARHLDTDAAPRRRPLDLVVQVAVLAVVLGLVVLDVDVPVLRPLAALVGFVALPTWVLYRRAFALPYAFGLTVLGLVVGGLLLDVALPSAGVDRPLAPAPLAIGWFVVDAALLAWRREIPLVRAGEVHDVRRALVDARLRLAPALAALSLLLSVVGAIRLNNGASGVVAIAAVVVGAAALLAQALGHDGRRDGWVLGLVAAGLLLATSLRGWAITGHDVQAEYLAFRLADGAQDWTMSALPSAYNACLSVTILPTVLAQATGLPGVVVFKVLLQLVFSVVPVLTYLLARRFLHRRLALAAAVLTIAFPTYFTDMPYLVRQELAFFFLALMLLAATSPARTRVRTRLLVLAFGVGVVLSHYSTTYVLLMALGGALALVAVASVVRRRRGRAAPEGPPSVLLHPGVVAALFAITLAWAGPITGTGGHAREVLSETVQSILGDGDDGPASSDTSYWVLAGDRATPEQRMDLFVGATLDHRDAEIPPELQVLRDPGGAVLSPAVREQPATPVKTACALVMQAFLLLGLVHLLRRRWGVGMPRELLYLTWGSMAALGLIVVVPNLSVDYGVLRAFQQTLLVVAPVMAMGMALALRRPFLAAVVPVALLVVLAGTQQRIAIANAGSYYDRFHVSDSEQQGIAWLGSVDRADRTNERLIANRNVNVRLLGLSDNRAPVSDRLYPTLLSRDAYVFVDGQILEQGESTVFYTGDLLTYRYPLRALDRHLDLVYSAPDARVYR
ncbi:MULTISPECIES: hypothetical protein [unclassified Nocardioides]|uniref:hypothetical protein n=1 Tax=unclassified Nocardioides TaxID=2615069 RepID=UPI003608E4AA